MTLQALTEIPEKFGLAKIEFDDQPTPSRIDDTISLPNTTGTGMKLYSLLDGTQFVLIIGEGRTPEVYFGGTDESPFLVELHTRYAATLLAWGETEFYQDLKPPIIKELELKLGATTTVRQGDIWAYELGYDWNKLGQSNRVIAKSHFAVNYSPTSIFGTRHRLDGGRIVRHTVVIPTTSNNIKVPKNTVGDGVLSAPDHQTVLLQGPHVFARTPGILPARREGAGQVGD